MRIHVHFFMDWLEHQLPHPQILALQAPLNYCQSYHSGCRPLIDALNSLFCLLLPAEFTVNWCLVQRSHLLCIDFLNAVGRSSDDGILNFHEVAKTRETVYNVHVMYVDRSCRTWACYCKVMIHRTVPLSLPDHETVVSGMDHQLHILILGEDQNGVTYM